MTSLASTQSELKDDTLESVKNFQHWISADLQIVRDSLTSLSISVKALEARCRLLEKGLGN